MKANRFSDSWDARLRANEKELLCSLAGGPKSWALVRWRDLDERARRGIIGSMRSLYELGRECERALSYSRNKGSARIP